MSEELVKEKKFADADKLLALDLSDTEWEVTKQIIDILEVSGSFQHAFQRRFLR